MFFYTQALARSFIASYILISMPGKTASTLFESIKINIVDPIITLLALAAFVVFIWGLVNFVRGADDAEVRDTGKRHMIWGIVGLVIIFGAGAIVQFIIKTVG